MKTKILMLLPLYILAAEPGWITDPTMNGKYVGAVGSAPDMGDSNTQEGIAMMRAKANLAATKHLEVESESNTYQDSTGKNNFSLTSSQKSADLLMPKEMDRYINSEGELFVWMVQP